MTQRIDVRTARAVWRPVRLRHPFRFGDVTVTEAREAYLRLDGSGTGHAAQLMVPRWFDKRPSQGAADTVRTLARSVVLACEGARGASGTTAGIAAEIRAAVVAGLPDTPPLAAGFGPALVEAALADMAARQAGATYAQAARADLFGLGEGGFLEAPARTLTIRHTVGYDAPLDDGPGGLAAAIAAGGLRAFKIKLKGDPEADVSRLVEVARVLDGLPAYHATLDGNEQYGADRFAEFLARLEAAPLERLRGAIRFIEQPIDRDAALERPAPPCPYPLLIDEADGTDDAFAIALRLGWSGTSVKSCKGVLRSIRNAALARRSGAILSAEDLTCQPGLAWAQDGVMAAALGLTDAERNGHHFAGGMQGATPAERAAWASAHPSTFTPEGGIAIRDGAVAIGSLVDAPGLGGDVVPDLRNDTELNEEDF